MRCYGSCVHILRDIRREALLKYDETVSRAFVCVCRKNNKPKTLFF